MPHRRPPHLDRRLYVGPVRIFLTMCTFKRAEYFCSQPTVDLVHAELLRTSGELAVEILAYCYMPDHVHLLVTGLTGGVDLLAFARKFRQRAGYAHRRHNGDARLWQEGFFDRILRDEDGTFQVISYVIGNPVRAGLCASPQDYPHCGSSKYRVEELAAGVQWRSTTLG
jgi:putative transposase